MPASTVGWSLEAKSCNATLSLKRNLNELARRFAGRLIFPLRERSAHAAIKHARRIRAHDLYASHRTSRVHTQTCADGAVFVLHVTWVNRLDALQQTALARRHWRSRPGRRGGRAGRCGGRWRGSRWSWRRRRLRCRHCGRQRSSYRWRRSNGRHNGCRHGRSAGHRWR